MFFYGEELLTPRPILKLEDHTLSAIRGCLFSIFALTLHIGGRYSICNTRTRNDVVPATHLSWNFLLLLLILVNRIFKFMFLLDFVV